MKKLLRKFLKALEWTFYGFVTLCLTFFGVKVLAFLIMAGHGIVGMMTGTMTDKYLYEFDIKAMKDNNVYISRTYSEKSNLNYHYIREVNGRIYADSKDARDASIVEDGKNIVKVYTEVPKYGQGFYFFMNKVASMDGDFFGREHYEFHIPKDSVTEDFKIDLE
ncbi:hypothetical protein [Bacillus phage vB_BanS-Thrax5]|nr:hypothetical protein [Bacillus phage vB_BanS-Thrax5]